jgi:hypothetical protein
MAKASLTRMQKLTETELRVKSAANYSVNWTVSENCAGGCRSKRKNRHYAAIFGAEGMRANHAAAPKTPTTAASR